MQPPPEQAGLSLGELARLIDAEVLGDPGVEIKGVAGIDEAKEGEVTFLANPRYQKRLRNTRASAVVVSEPVADLAVAQLVVADPYYAFSRIVNHFYQKPYRPRGVHPSASIGRETTLGSDLSIHPFVAVGDGVVIGDRVTLHPGVVVGERSVIGEDSILYANVSIRENVTIGKRVIIHSGSVVGSDGFGFATHGGHHHKIPQVGTVVIEDDVEIGANVTIDRAAMGRTVIGRGTKIDNLVQIAHNVVVGQDSLLVAQVGISGSTRIGSRVTLAGQVGLAGHLTLGDNVLVGAKSGVMRDIPANEAMSGIPALPHKAWLEVQASLPRLPEIRRRLKALESRLESLEGKKTGRERKKNRAEKERDDD
jgi:UDP-3-O-[3-hydroxymyristoyl] glucosamine N-acyltransferase